MMFCFPLIKHKRVPPKNKLLCCCFLQFALNSARLTPNVCEPMWIISCVPSVICTIMRLFLLFQSCLNFELTYNAPDGSVGAWQKEGFEYSQGHAEDEGGYDEGQHLLSGHDRGSDTDSLPSSPSKSFKGSRLSITSRASQSLKSPTRAWVHRLGQYLALACLHVSLYDTLSHITMASEHSRVSVSSAIRAWLLVSTHDTQRSDN